MIKTLRCFHHCLLLQLGHSHSLRLFSIFLNFFCYFYLVLLNRAPTSTQPHPPPPGSIHLYQLHPPPPSSILLHQAPSTSTKLHPPPPSSIYLHPAPSTSSKLHPPPPSSIQLHPASSTSTQLHPAPPSFTQLHSSPPSSMLAYMVSQRC